MLALTLLAVVGQFDLPPTPAPSRPSRPAPRMAQFDDIPEGGFAAPVPGRNTPGRNTPRSSAPLAGNGLAPQGGVEITDRGTIRLVDRAELAVAQNGIIVNDVPVEGTRVSKGDVIVQLDTTVPEAALEVARVTAESDIDEELARKYYDVAANEYQQAIEANKIVADAVSQLETERLFLTAERSRLDILKAQDEQDIAIAREQEAAAVLDSYTATAPFDGVITNRAKQRGEAVRPGDPVVEIVSTDRVQVIAPTPIEYLDRMQVGTEVAIYETYRNAVSPLRGCVVLVQPSGVVTGGAKIDVLIEVENPGGRLVPGLNVRVVAP